MYNRKKALKGQGKSAAVGGPLSNDGNDRAPSAISLGIRVGQGEGAFPFGRGRMIPFEGLLRLKVIEPLG